ncbi:Heparan-sulfate 6-O-sulfotransferase 2 [Fukomys damarensis]|uniref:Heparan-sulfate 6-O-sulfotransferase n=1 Tax=Fukomys damarensis TaxID=885580 RepID=A0A091CNL6_FUKDA|nr:Heparan-sulfate 6-O-sulfotransferase 2 [Fukomys damarensis]
MDGLVTRNFKSDRPTLKASTIKGGSWRDLRIETNSLQRERLESELCAASVYHSVIAGKSQKNDSPNSYELNTVLRPAPRECPPFESESPCDFRRANGEESRKPSMGYFLTVWEAGKNHDPNKMENLCYFNSYQALASNWFYCSFNRWRIFQILDAARNFHYITILRDPVSRYLSEWRHVQRGATWKASLHVCDGRPPTSEELPSCYPGDDWSGCPLKEFMDCPYNLANNRQVRMLSDLTLVGCYNLSVMPEKQRNKVLLESAKSNLKHMAFFGLTEFQRKTQYLFEKTFNMNFISPFTQYNTTRASSVEINEEVQKRIERLNFLDMELYTYAKDLFLQRYQFMRQKEHQEARRKRQEQRKFLKGRFLQTHFQGQSRGQSQNPTQNQSQNPNFNANQNLTQNLIPNLTQNSSQDLSHKGNRSNQKRNPGQEQNDSNSSNGTNDYIGSVEKWR